MKIASAAGTLGLLVIAVIASPFATAGDMGWYGGFSVGQSRAKIDDERIASSLLGANLGTASITDDDRDIGYKLFAGYQFNRNFAVEGGYFDLGKFGFTATVPTGTLTGQIKLRGVNLDLVGILPITQKLSALGRVGVNYAEARDHFAGTGAVIVTNPNPSKRDTNYKFGLGLQYDFTPSLGMRAEVERYRINDAIGNKGDVDLVSLGLVFRFGGKMPAACPACPAPRPAAAPAPRPAAAPAPAPRPAAVTPRPAEYVAPPPPAPIERTRKDRN